jgi:predicted site-specific integrase-resolvase
MEYAEFARLIGTSVYTIQRWVKTGHVNARNFGARIHRIHCSEYDRLSGLLGETKQA